ncbi:uncharacterized protein ighd [Garra rufa]|uniref:uncharacterized protein ighd n=1 Tax=Garra rufa TaxID=137080 RepID=UPI003CCE7089
MFLTSLLLLLAAMTCECVECNIVLTQTNSIVLRPGDSLTLTCEVSGYSVTDNSYATAWIRHPAGKALEWIVHIWGGGGITKKDSLANKFSISKSDSSKTVTLKGQNLQTEDTAVYYCARRPQHGVYFDYWGKGTKVTVSSAQASAPKSIVGMSQCTPGSDGFITIGCLARGFSPADSLTFTWKDPADKELTDFVQFPAFGREGDYTKISYLRVRKNDSDPQKPYKCEASNRQGKKDADIIPPPPPRDQPATLYLTVPTKAGLDNGTATFMCVAQRFSPKAYAFKWFQDGKDLTDAIDTYEKSEKNGSVTEYSVTSILQITAEQWKPNSKVKCHFEHKMGNEEKEVEYPGMFSLKNSNQDCIDNTDIKPNIVPPSTEDMLKNREGALKCKASAGNPGFTKITIKANNNVIAYQSEEYLKTKNTVELDAPIGYEEWSNGTIFTCTVEHKDLAVPKETTFRRENGKDPQKPTVFIIAPPEHKTGEPVTLMCYVKDFYPKEVFVSWLVDDEPLTSEYSYSTSQPIKNGQHFSVYSQLTVHDSDWKSGAVFSCVVYHEGIDDKMRVLTRSIDDKMEKAGVINLSMNTPACCKNCHANVFLSVPTEWIVWIEQPLYEATDDSGIANTAVTFVFLFLITLFYSIGATFVKNTDKGEKNYTYISQRSISASYEDKKYTCKATFNFEEFKEEYDMCHCQAQSLFKPSVQIKRAHLKDIIQKNKVTLSCVVKAPDNTKVSWLTNIGATSEVKDPPSIVSNLTLSKDEWLNLRTACTAKHPCFQEEKAEYTHVYIKESPVVMIRSHLIKSTQAVLECVVNDLPSGEVCIIFQVNTSDISNLSCMDWAPSENIWSLTTRITIPSEHQKNGNVFTCKVHRPFKFWTSQPTVNIFGIPTIELTVVPSVGQSSSDSQKLLCSVTGFDPKIKWLSQSREKTGKDLDVTVLEDGRVIAYSEILVPQQEWNRGVTYTCQAANGKSQATDERSTSVCAGKHTKCAWNPVVLLSEVNSFLKPSANMIAPHSQQAGVYLLGPSLSNVRSATDVFLTCLVVGQSVKLFSIEWKVNGKLCHGYGQNPKDHNNGTESTENILKVSVKEWNGFAVFTCEVKHLCSNNILQRNISKTRDSKQPTLRILRPSDSDLSGLQNANLLCLITGFFPSDISVQWQLNGTELDASQFSNSPVVDDTSGGFAMHSALMLPASERKDGVFTCVVFHESSQSPITATIENLYASVTGTAPSAKLLQGYGELVCLIFGFSPPAINITWLRGTTEVSAHRVSDPAKGPDGKFSIQSHLDLKPPVWAPGEVYTCQVTHVAGNVSRSISKTTGTPDFKCYNNLIKKIMRL